MQLNFLSQISLQFQEDIFLELYFDELCFRVISKRTSKNYSRIEETL